MHFHEAPPASDAIGSVRKMNVQSYVSLVLFVAVLAGFLGIVTHVIDATGLFVAIRDFIGLVAGLLGHLIGK
ncbi:MAG TPA: hypothetical protein VEH07_00260 [Alphaproteobacteria bacterium]|nr:hypothetical protein [Alphaproteobacteria bacterium]